MRKAKPGSYVTDYLTVIALSMLAYTLAVVLHEHLGHAPTCASLGGHTAELGAYYVDCQYAGMPDISIRLVALAGSRDDDPIAEPSPTGTTAQTEPVVIQTKKPTRRPSD